MPSVVGRTCHALTSTTATSPAASGSHIALQQPASRFLVRRTGPSLSSSGEL